MSMWIRMWLKMVSCGDIVEVCGLDASSLVRRISGVVLA